MRDNVTLLAGAEQVDAAPWLPFDPRAVDFLAELSAEVLRGPDTRRQEASAAFGFWCRRARLEALAARHASPLPRLGRGLAFHLAPANVPALFAYTLAIGLLAGNANVVRLSSRRMEEAPCWRPSAGCWSAGARRRAGRTSLITYGRDDAVTADYCARCDARIVWGGDAAVAAVRAMPMPPRRGAVLPRPLVAGGVQPAGLLRPHAGGAGALAHRFYNDTYQMDQNACSSPQLVLWLEDGETPPAAPGGGRRWPLRRRSATPSAPSRRPASWSGCASAP
ncbi:MAG: acyl-CoA reductase [Flavonifractor plautii]